MKKICHLIAFCSCLFFVFSCSHKEDKFKSSLYYANNFESVHGWSETPQIIKCEAHSGKYACQIDKDNIYSMGFNVPVKEIGSGKVKKVTLKAWIKVENLKSWAKMVIEGRDVKDSIIFWYAGKTSEFTKNTGEWFPVSYTFDVPANLNPEGRIKVYLYNQENEVLLADDLEIQFEE